MGDIESSCTKTNDDFVVARYCSYRELIKLITERKVSFSSFESFYDKNEGKYLDEVFPSILKELKDDGLIDNQFYEHVKDARSFHNVINEAVNGTLIKDCDEWFVYCLSRSIDDVNLWNDKTTKIKRDYCVVLDIKGLLKPSKPELCLHNYQMCDVLYKKTEKDNLLRENIMWTNTISNTYRARTRNILINEMKRDFLFLKDEKEFGYEKECRAILSLNPNSFNGNKFISKIKKVEIKGKERKYVDVSVNNKAILKIICRDITSDNSIDVLEKARQLLGPISITGTDKKI